MIDVFSDEFYIKLQQLKKGKTIYCFDYDGTIAPIVADPLAARISQSTRDQLIELRKSVPLALISGRSVKNLKDICEIKFDHFVGNHGIEDGSKLQHEYLEKCQEINFLWQKEIKNSPFILELGSNLLLEYKDYSMSIHYKEEGLLTKINSFFSNLTPKPKIISGKHVINLLPDLGKNKGTAILALMQEYQYSNAFFIGDDVTDEDVFKLKHPQILTVHIGNSLNSQANYKLENQHEIDILLEKIIKSF